MAKMKQFFQRMIAVAPRICSQCEDEISEGEIYFKPKDASVWCQACKEYDDDKE